MAIYAVIVTMLFLGCFSYWAWLVHGVYDLVKDYEARITDLEGEVEILKKVSKEAESLKDDYALALSEARMVIRNREIQR